MIFRQSSPLRLRHSFRMRQRRLLALCISSLMARKYLIDASLCDDIRAEARAEGATEMTTPRKIISG